MQAIKPYTPADIINGKEAMRILRINSYALFKRMRDRGDIPYHTKKNGRRHPSSRRIYYYRSEIERLLCPKHLSLPSHSAQPDPSPEFMFGTLAIRMRVIDDKPYFAAKDVCEALGIKFYRNAITSLDTDETATVLINTSSGTQQMTAVNESGLYHLILQSRKAAARAFRRWITEEVLPTLRRTGRYEIRATPAVQPQSWFLYTNTTASFS